MCILWRALSEYTCEYVRVCTCRHTLAEGYRSRLWRIQKYTDKHTHMSYDLESALLKSEQGRFMAFQSAAQKGKIGGGMEKVLNVSSLFCHGVIMRVTEDTKFLLYSFW